MGDHYRPRHSGGSRGAPGGEEEDGEQAKLVRRHLSCLNGLIQAQHKELYHGREHMYKSQQDGTP